MTGSQERLSEELTPQQVDSMGTPIPEFSALQDIPAYLGHNAHGRLEEILGKPVATDDAQPTEEEETGRRAGVKLGDIVGREKVFRENLPKIEANVQDIAVEQGISVAQVWSEVIEVLQGSGIGHPMHRTVDRPVGGDYGATMYVNENSASGIALIIRSNIHNWDMRRNARAASLLGSISTDARQNVELIIHAGGARQHRGDNELWQPEVQPYLSIDSEGRTISSLTEARVAEELRAPRSRELIGELGLRDQVEVGVVKVDDPKASGDTVVRSIIEAYGDKLKDLLIVEAGNAPAGYTQLAGALVLAKELGIDPTRQYLAVSDDVTIVQPDFYQALTPEEQSRVQNGATALNSLNGWLQTIVRVNQYMWDRTKL